METNNGGGRNMAVNFNDVEDMALGIVAIEDNIINS
jgi:hypothetical protein